MVKRGCLFAICGMLSMGITACAVMDHSQAPRLDRGAKWVMFPFGNHTETPQAGLRAEAITETVLRSLGVGDLRQFPMMPAPDVLVEPADPKAAEAALAWAKSQQARYAVTGSVDEWRYKVGVDGEPAVGVSLRLIDLQTNQVVWSAGGGRTGWSREAVSAVAQKLIKSLLTQALPTS
jgi:TolB-like protein